MSRKFRLLGLAYPGGHQRIPAVVGIFSAFHEETRVTIAASATQFEAAIRDEIGAWPTR
jgi:hypothetical protein